MEYQTIKELISKKFKETFFVVLIFGGGAITFFWNEYKELSIQKDSLSKQVQNLNLEKIAFEKYRAEHITALQKQKMELEKREFFLTQIEHKNHDDSIALQKSAVNYREALAKLEVRQKKVSTAEQLRNAEEKIQNLMSEFSSMGVNLNSALKCNDNQAEAKFNVAKAKFYEILAISESYGLKEKYETFFFRNSPRLWHACIE